MVVLESDVFRMAVERGLDPIVVGCLIQQESSWNVMAYREEPQINDASYGLMQILYGTAKGMGYEGPPEGLYEPVTNLHWGLMYWKNSLDAHEGHVLWALAGYNAGIGGTVATRRREGVDAWKDYAHPGAVLRWHGTVVAKMALRPDQAQSLQTLDALSANSSSIIGWIEEIGALEAVIEERTHRARQLGEDIIQHGRTLELRRLLVETRTRVAREVQQLGQAVQGL